MRKLAFVLAAWLAGGSALAEQRIGVAAAVVPATSDHSESGDVRSIDDGSDMFRRHRVLTETAGRAQLVFLDGSALTVGENSDVLLDEFVYDPDRGAGETTLAATRGVFRYVGGRISKRSDVMIRTPTATIGIRGGIVVVTVTPDGRSNAYFLFGERMTVSSGGQVQVAMRPGSMIAFGPGQPPTPPRVATPGELGEATRGLQAQPAALQQQGAMVRPDTGSATRLASMQPMLGRSEAGRDRGLAGNNAPHGPMGPGPVGAMLAPRPPVEGVIAGAFNLGLQPRLLAGSTP